ncbi:MAG: thiamine pyrophosphate-dependent dehydrogenase E1 component subunit alpha [Candidatus Omnitrophota bacterium]
MIQFDKNKLKEIHQDILIDLYRIMLRIRMIEDAIGEEYPKDEMKTPIHLCTGQEAIPAGVCKYLKKDDYVLSNYRGHGHYLAKGGDLRSLIAELYGRDTGCCRGRGGSMHIVDVSVGIVGTSAIVGGGVPIATGIGLASVLEKNSRVSVVFFGDGAVDEGVLYESINFSMLKKLPVIYACENNFYAVCSHQSKRQPRDNIYCRFQGCGIPGYRVDGNNVIEVYQIAKNVIDNARRGGGPAFIEFRTYRWKGHSGNDSDVSLGYRTQEELDEWVKRCPLKNFENFLLDERIIAKEQIRLFEQDIDKEIQEAFEFAQKSPFPDEESIMDYLYKEK